MTDPLRSAYLGQFSFERSNLIAEALEEAGISWTYKQFGRWTKLFFAGEWGVRLYVDAGKVEAARAIALATPEPTEQR